MPFRHERTRRLFIDVFFPDPARPVEWFSLLGLSGWAWFLALSPDVLDRDTFTAFKALPPWAWAGLMFLVAFVQLFAMLPIGARAMTRFFAMACACGLWTVVAINFLSASVWTTGVLTYCGYAAMTFLTGVWLGWASKNS